MYKSKVRREQWMGFRGGGDHPYKPNLLNILYAKSLLNVRNSLSNSHQTMNCVKQVGQFDLK